jgi:excisionase family DNA binding protein
MADLTVRPDGLITTDQAAQLCGVASVTVRQWIRRGHLPSVRRERGKILLNLIEVARTEQTMRARNHRASPLAPLGWQVDGDPEVDMAIILRLCDEAAASQGVRVSTPVVYYLQFAGRVKIGTTGRLRQRLESVPHDELLAVEPGDARIERQRHRQFAQYRISGEWFQSAPPLMAHIATLKSLPATCLAPGHS